MTAWIGFLHPWAWHTRSIGLLLLLRTSAQVEHTGCPHWKIRHSWGTSLQNGHFIWTCDASWGGSTSPFVSASESTSPSWSDSSESDSLSLWIACFGDFKFATRDKKCWIYIVGFGPDIWFHRVSISSSFFLSHALVLYVLTLFSNLAMFRSKSLFGLDHLFSRADSGFSQTAKILVCILLSSAFVHYSSHSYCWFSIENET